MISVSVRTLDYIDEHEEFDTMEDAMPYLDSWLGDMWDYGSSYAVNAWGDVTVYLDGASWEDYRKAKNATT